jgi:putative glutamine amidotransferase
VNRPIIGITLDHEKPGGYSNYPWYALRESYFNAIYNQGGLPIALPYHPDLAEQYFKMINGLVITGGNFDIDPSLYGEKITSDKVITKDIRTNFEIAITNLALKNQMPILGICGGHQLINVILGGSLIQHIPDSVPNCLIHEQPEPKHLPWHDIMITSGSLLHKITGFTTIKVNSTHHQAIKEAAPEMLVCAIAADGVIEAIEHKTHPFCLGVEWHPEYENIAADSAIFKSFINATIKYRQSYGTNS